MWFEVDKGGLAKLLERKGKEFVVFELIQNAWDENVSEVRVSIDKPHYGYSKIIVCDDSPEGFDNLSHAWCLFAESNKKIDPNKRGRFNLGEKLVLAICRQAEISTVKGTVLFDSNGRHNLRKKQIKGSIFTGDVKISQSEYENIIDSIERLIPPENINTFVNDIELKRPKLLKSFEMILTTELSDGEGILRRVERKTNVEIFESENGWLYEMGLPIVEITGKYNVNICQKVPLNLDRDNISPSYLRRVRTAIIDNMYESFTQDDVNQTWVRDGIVKTQPEVFTSYIKKKFGENAVIRDLSDVEANSISLSQGRIVVSGGMLSADEWQRVKETKAILPAGQVTPSPKAYSDDPNARCEEILLKSDYSNGMLRLEKYSKFVANEILGFDINVRITRAGNNFLAAYGNKTLTFNLNCLGNAFFDKPISVEHNSLLIHEFAHEYESNHLSDKYYSSLCEIGAKLFELLLQDKTRFPMLELMN